MTCDLSPINKYTGVSQITIYFLKLKDKKIEKQINIQKKV